jgi:hypothetical protein
MGIPGDVAIKTSSFRELMARSRLSPVRRNGGRPGLAIRFLFAEEPIRDFREMPRYGADSRRMALAAGDALIEATDVTVRVAAAHQTDRVGGFDERPLEVAVDVRAGPTEARLAPAGVERGVVPA